MPHQGAPRRVLVAEEHQGRLLQQGADDDELQQPKKSLFRSDARGWSRAGAGLDVPQHLSSPGRSPTPAQAPGLSTLHPTNPVGTAAVRGRTSPC